MKRQPQSVDDTADRSEHVKRVALGRSRHQTHELRTVVVDPTVDPRKAFTLRKLSKPGEAPQPWRTSQSTAAATARTVGGATMQVPIVKAEKAPDDLRETGGVAESIAAHKLKARRTVRIDETAPMPDVAPREPRTESSSDETPPSSSTGIDVPPPSGVAIDSRLLAELTPRGLKAVKAAPKRRSRPLTPTPLGLGPVTSSAPTEDEATGGEALDEPYDIEDEKITRPLRRAPQALPDAVTLRMPVAAGAPPEAVAVEGFPWPVAAATGVAVLALVAYLMFASGAEPTAPDTQNPGSREPVAHSEAEAKVPEAPKRAESQSGDATPTEEIDSIEDAQAAESEGGSQAPSPVEQPKPSVRPKPAGKPTPAEATPSSTGRLF